MSGDCIDSKLRLHISLVLWEDFIPFNSEMVVPVNCSIAMTLAVKPMGSMHAEGGCGCLMSN